MHHGDATISPNMVESPKFHVVYYNADIFQRVGKALWWFSQIAVTMHVLFNMALCAVCT